MIDKTKQKFLDAALKLFAEKGYIGATTLAISEEAGFSEKTLFRKFKTKKNLFNMVISQNNERFMDDLNLLLQNRNTEFENHDDFLRALIRDLARMTDDNFEIINLVSNETNRIPRPLIEEFNMCISEHIEKNIPNDKINCNALALSIYSIIYILSLDKRRKYTLINHEEIIDGFITNSILSIQS